jgi:hypothetical protein
MIESPGEFSPAANERLHAMKACLISSFKSLLDRLLVLSVDPLDPIIVIFSWRMLFGGDGVDGNEKLFSVSLEPKKFGYRWKNSGCMLYFEPR